MAPLWHFWRKTMKLFVKNVQPLLLKFFLNTSAISLRVHKYGFVLLNRVRSVTDTVYSNPRTANYWKMSKNGFSLKTSLQIHRYTLVHAYTQLIVLKSRFPSHALFTKENLDLYVSSLARWLGSYNEIITLWPIALATHKLLWLFLASWCRELSKDIIWITWQ